MMTKEALTEEALLVQKSLEQEQEVLELLKEWQNKKYTYNPATRKHDVDPVYHYKGEYFIDFDVHRQALLQDTNVKKYIRFSDFPTKTSIIKNLIDVVRAKKNLQSIEFTQDIISDHPESGRCWTSVSAHTWNEMFSAINENSNIKSLHFSIHLKEKTLNKEKVEIISERIKSNQHLKEVSISRNIGSLPNELFQLFISSIFANPRIETFYLDTTLNENQQSYFLDLLEKSKTITHFFKPSEGSKLTELDVLRVSIQRNFTSENYDRLLKILVRNKHEKGNLDRHSGDADVKRNHEVAGGCQNMMSSTSTDSTLSTAMTTSTERKINHEAAENQDKEKASQVLVVAQAPVVAETQDRLITHSFDRSKSSPVFYGLLAAGAAAVAGLAFLSRKR